jgi:hypothetical protein
VQKVAGLVQEADKRVGCGLRVSGSDSVGV